MTDEELRRLKEGDVVQHADGDGYVIVRDMGRTKLAIRTIEVSNPSEWSRVLPPVHPFPRQEKP